MKIKRSNLIVLLSLSLLVLGCSKDNDNDSPSETPKTNKEMLTAHTWQVKETYQNISGTRTHYVRGGENTTGVNMGATRLKFNTDGKGSTTDVNGDTFNITWGFTSADERSLHIVVNGTVEYDWIFTDINEDIVISTSIVSTNGLLSVIWEPVP